MRARRRGAGRRPPARRVRRRQRGRFADPDPVAARHLHAGPQAGRPREQLDALLTRRARCARRRRARGPTPPPPPARSATATARRRATRAASRSATSSCRRRLVRRRRPPGDRARPHHLRRRGIRGRFATQRRITAAAPATAGASPARRPARAPAVGDRAGQRAPPEHFVVLAPAGLDVAALPDALEDGYARMGDVLERPRLRRRYLVVVAGGAQAARALTESIRGVESLAAISDAEVQETGRRSGSARRLASGSSSCGRRSAGLGPTAASASSPTSSRTPRSRAYLRPHPGVAHRGGRALRLRGPPRRPGGAAARERRALPPLPGLSAPTRSRASAARQSPPTPTPRRPRSTSSSATAAAVSCASTTPSTTRRSRAPRGPRAGAPVRRELGTSLPALERDMRDWIRRAPWADPHARATL